MSIGFVVGFSIFLQFCAVLLSFRLMTSPKNRIAALLIMGSCSLSATRRIITMTELLRGRGGYEWPLLPETLALCGSLFMVLGLLWFEPRSVPAEADETAGNAVDAGGTVNVPQDLIDCRACFHAMPAAFAIHRVVVDGRGYPIDYEFLDVNPAFERQTGLKRGDVIGKRVTQVIPGMDEVVRQWITNYGRVALTGQPMEFEDYAAPLRRWYAVQAFSPRRGYFITIFQDISERKHAEAAQRRGAPYSALAVRADGGATDGTGPLPRAKTV
ncbi:MAG TPA: PAS domain S-box protein [bacterium]|nr:PAS domain S-box protein [bacterium]